MKITTSIRLEESLADYAKTKGNMSRYISGLIKSDLAAENSKPIIRGVAEALLADEAFVSEVAERAVRKSQGWV